MKHSDDIIPQSAGMVPRLDWGIASKFSMAHIPLNELDLNPALGSPIEGVQQLGFFKRAQDMRLAVEDHGWAPPRASMSGSHFHKTGPGSISLQTRAQEEKTRNIVMWKWPFNAPALKPIPLPKQSNPQSAKSLWVSANFGHHMLASSKLHLPRLVSFSRAVERTERNSFRRM